MAVFAKWRQRRRQRKTHEVVFHTYPKLVFAWPLIVMGLIFYPFTAAGAQEALGWAYLFTAVVVILTVSVDVERNYAAFWVVIFLALFLGLTLLAEKTDIPLFTDLYHWLADRDVMYNRGFGLMMSILLGLPYVVMILWARLQHKWRITNNEFEHYSWGRADDSLARGAKRVRSTYPDLLELVLLGAGTLIVYSATGRTELRRIPNVPLIHWVRKRIDRILEATQVTMNSPEIINAEEIEAEEEEMGPPAEDAESEMSAAEDRL